MSEFEQKYERALARLRAAESAYGSAESELIAARREVRDTERDYIKERFPTKEALRGHFR